MQYLQVGETMTVAATSTRIYSWGGLVGGERLVVGREGVKSYRMRKDQLEVNPDLDEVKEATNKHTYYLQKYQVMQQIKDKIFHVSQNLKVIELACGNGHVICRTASKQVYTWGFGVNGQLGHGSCYS